MVWNTEWCFWLDHALFRSLRNLAKIQKVQEGRKKSNIAQHCWRIFSAKKHLSHHPWPSNTIPWFCQSCPWIVHAPFDWSTSSCLFWQDSSWHFWGCESSREDDAHQTHFLLALSTELSKKQDLRQKWWHPEVFPWCQKMTSISARIAPLFINCR